MAIGVMVWWYGRTTKKGYPLLSFSLENKRERCAGSKATLEANGWLIIYTFHFEI